MCTYRKLLIKSNRSNFYGNKIIAHYEDFERYGTFDEDGSFIGYHGDIGTWVQQAFNFSYDLHPMLNKDSFETILNVMIRYFRYRYMDENNSLSISRFLFTSTPFENVPSGFPIACFSTFRVCFDKILGFLILDRCAVSTSFHILKGNFT